MRNIPRTGPKLLKDLEQTHEVLSVEWVGRRWDYLTMVTKNLGDLGREKCLLVATEENTDVGAQREGLRLTLPCLSKSLSSRLQFLTNEINRGGNSSPTSFSSESFFFVL